VILHVSISCETCELTRSCKVVYELQYI